MSEQSFTPTDEQRRLVRAFAGIGVKHAQLARHLGVDAATLSRHFAEDLDRGALEATAKVAQSLLQMATTGKNVAAAIFWMKARGGWRETSQVEHQVPQNYVIHTGVPRGNTLEDVGTAEDQALAVDGDEAGSRYVIVVPRKQALEEWTAEYCTETPPGTD